MARGKVEEEESRKSVEQPAWGVWQKKEETVLNRVGVEDQQPRLSSHLYTLHMGGTYAPTLTNTHRCTHMHTKDVQKQNKTPASLDLPRS